MEENKLYFIKNEYFEKYKCNNYKPNKEPDSNGEHNRPCYYAFKENNIYWMIPVSSQCAKYEKIYEKTIKRYGLCDGISFGYVKGNKNAFLIQNMVPVTLKYIDKIYTSGKQYMPVELNEKIKRELNAKARKALRFSRNGKALTFTPILDLEKLLLEELKESNF